MAEFDFLEHKNAKESIEREKEHYNQPRTSSALTVWESCGQEEIAWKEMGNSVKVFYFLGKWQETIRIHWSAFIPLGFA